MYKHTLQLSTNSFPVIIPGYIIDGQWGGPILHFNMEPLGQMSRYSYSWGTSPKKIHVTEII